MMNGETHTTADHTTDDPPTMHDVDNPMTIIVVFFVVLGLALANIGLSMLGLGKLALPVQLGIGIVQACVVAYYWMHMRRKDTVVTLTALSALFFLFIMFVLTLSDYLTRHYMAI
jgi:cytochrome c oxidase subunit 4